MITTPHFGVYLNLPEQEYHADPSLSASGIKDMVASPLTYWTKNLDPNRDDDSDTPTQKLGRAIHKIILEGSTKFMETYAAEPRPSDYPGCLQGVEALRAKCEQLGVKKSGTLEEMSNRILERDPECILWPVIKSEFLASVAGSEKMVITGDTYQQCQRASAAIIFNDSARTAFKGGIPEVSVFWKTPDGVPMKSRFDYLKPHAIVDLKTFSNTNGASVDSTVVFAVAKYLYHVQAYVYLQAATAAKLLINDGYVYGDGGNDLLQFARVGDDPSFFFVFVETGPVTNVLVRELNQFRAPLVCEKGRMLFVNTIATWKAYMDEFGPDKPWIMNQPVRPFLDEEFPLWAV